MAMSLRGCQLYPSSTNCVSHCVWGATNSIGDAGSFVLGLLFLADVELLGSLLAFGESVTVTVLSSKLYHNM